MNDEMNPSVDPKDIKEIKDKTTETNQTTKEVKQKVEEVKEIVEPISKKEPERVDWENKQWEKEKEIRSLMIPPFYRRILAFFMYSIAFGLILTASIASRKATRREKIINAFFSSSTQAMCIVDEKHVVVQWSYGMEKLFGWSEAEAEGRDITFLVPPDMKQEHNSKLTEAFNRFDPNKLEQADNGLAETLIVKCDGIKKDASKFPIRLTVRFFGVEGEKFAASGFDHEEDVAYFNARTGAKKIPEGRAAEERTVAKPAIPDP